MYPTARSERRGENFDACVWTPAPLHVVVALPLQPLHLVTGSHSVRRPRRSVRPSSSRLMSLITNCQESLTGRSEEFTDLAAGFGEKVSPSKFFLCIGGMRRDVLQAGWRPLPFVGACIAGGMWASQWEIWSCTPFPMEIACFRFCSLPHDPPFPPFGRRRACEPEGARRASASAARHDILNTWTSTRN